MLTRNTLPKRMNENWKLERYVWVVKYRLHTHKWLVYYYEVVAMYNDSRYHWIRPLITIDVNFKMNVKNWTRRWCCSGLYWKREVSSDFRLLTSDFRLRTSDFGLQTSDFRCYSSLFLLRTSHFRLECYCDISAIISHEKHGILFRPVLLH